MQKQIVLSKTDEIITNAIRNLIEIQYGYACTCLIATPGGRNKLWEHSCDVIEFAIKNLDTLENKQVADHYKELLYNLQKIFSDAQHRQYGAERVYLPVFRQMFDHNGVMITPNKKNEYTRTIQGFYRDGTKKDNHWKKVCCDTIYGMVYSKEYICKNGLVIFDYGYGISVYGWSKCEKFESNKEFPFADTVLSNSPFSINTLEFLTDKYGMDNEKFIRTFAFGE